MQPAFETQKPVTKTLQAPLATIIVGKAGQPIVPPLHDVLRDSGQIEGKTRHAYKLGCRPCAGPSVQTALQHQAHPLPDIRIVPDTISGHACAAEPRHHGTCQDADAQQERHGADAMEEYLHGAILTGVCRRGASDVPR